MERNLAFSAHDGEVVFNYAIKMFRLHFHRKIVIRAMVVNLHEEIARMTAAQGPLNRSEVCRQEMIHSLGIVGEAQRRTGLLKQPMEFILIRIGYVYLVWDAP